MGHVSIDMEIEATPEEVWRVVSDPRNLPKWDRHILSVQGVPADGLKEGVRYTTELKMLGVKGSIEAEVLEIDPPKQSRIRLRGLLDATVKTIISPLAGGKRSLLDRLLRRTSTDPPVHMDADALRDHGDDVWKSLRF